VSEPEHWWRVYRVTIDTNIFVSSVIQRRGFANYLISLWRYERFVLVLSNAIINEIRETLSQLRLRRGYSYTPQTITRLINLLTRQAIIVEVPSSYELCRRRDMDDDPVADCAIWGRTQFLVSYDNDFLENPTLKQALFEYGVEIVDPHAFVGRIQEG
jgi:putative PIN family toxin of toxin-antitoxin system